MWIRWPLGQGSVLAAIAVTTALIAAGCGGGGAQPDRQDVPATRPSTTTPIEEAATRAVGRRDCEGLKPLQAARRFTHAARRAGATRQFIDAVAHPQAVVRRSPGYPRLVGSLYATTVPAKQSVAAAAGCVEELVAPSRGR